ncbi:MAG: preprotein translocase subunit SecE [Planctomycetota bacterium]
MAMRVYKPGQGYWTRMLSAIGFGALGLGTAAWLWTEFSGVRSEYRLYIQAGVALTLVATLGLVLFHFLGASKKTVDFLIATEVEMRKVNWPTRKTIAGLTWVVIAGTFLIALLLYVIDIVFGYLFTQTGILDVN